jgi:hypothetical protein
MVNVLTKINNILAKHRMPVEAIETEGITHLRFLTERESEIQYDYADPEQSRHTRTYKSDACDAEAHVRRSLELKYRLGEIKNNLPTSVAAACLVVNDLTSDELSILRNRNIVALKSISDKSESRKRYAVRESPQITSHWKLDTLSWLINTSKYPDVNLCSDIQEGFRLTGEVPNGSIFKTAKSKSKSKRKKTTARPVADGQHMAAVLKFLSTMAQKGDDNLASELRSMTKDEVAKGWLSNVNLSDLEDFYVSPRFIIQQNSKLRIIDHLSFRQGGLKYYPAASVNTFGTLKHKTTFPGLNHLDNMMALQSKKKFRAVMTLDFEAAYKQLAVKKIDKDLALVAILSDDRSSLDCFRSESLPFGSIHSVSAFSRVAIAHTNFISSFLFIPIVNYLDDLISLDVGDDAQTREETEPESETLTMIKAFFGLTGAKLKQSKIKIGKILEVLGLTFDVTGGSKVNIAVDRSKIENIIRQIDEAIDTRYLSSKLSGKICFMMSATPGRCGAALSSQLCRISQRCFTSGSEFSEEERTFLEDIKKILRGDFKLELPRRSPNWNVLICYTDACTNKGDRLSGVGSLVIPYGQFSLKNSICATFEIDCSEVFAGKSTAIIPLELFSSIICVSTILSLNLISKTDVIFLFIDNTSALSILTNGSSSCSPLNEVIDKFWQSYADREIMWNYVESANNIADGPSRADFKSTLLLNPTKVPIHVPKWMPGKIRQLF